MSVVKFIGAPEADDKAGPSTPKAPKNKTLTYIIEGAIVLLACVLGLVIRLAVYETAIVTSDSMLPALARSDRLLVDHRSSLSGKWKRGDIIIFEPPVSWQDENLTDSYIKRVVGLPGETVQVLYGRVLINNKPLAEPYRKDAAREDDSTLPVMLARGQYWVMGDNRENSFDSRMAGPLPNEAINGRAVYRLGPFGRTGSLKQAGT